MRELPAVGYIRQADLLHFVPFSKATLWRLSASGAFPKPIKLAPRITAWRCEDVHAWMANVNTGKSTNN